MTGALDIKPTGNEQSGWCFPILKSGSIIDRKHWKPLPMPAEVINIVEAIARNSAVGFEVTNIHGMFYDENELSDEYDSDYNSKDFSSDDKDDNNNNYISGVEHEDWNPVDLSEAEETDSDDKTSNKDHSDNNYTSDDDNNDTSDDPTNDVLVHDREDDNVSMYDGISIEAPANTRVARELKNATSIQEFLKYYLHSQGHKHDRIPYSIPLQAPIHQTSGKSSSPVPRNNGGPNKCIKNNSLSKLRLK